MKLWSKVIDHIYTCPICDSWEISWCFAGHRFCLACGWQSESCKHPYELCNIIFKILYSEPARLVLWHRTLGHINFRKSFAEQYEEHPERFVKL